MKTLRTHSLNRRSFLAGCAAVAGNAMTHRLSAEEPAAVLQVAAAGSVRGLLEGPLKEAAAKSLGLTLQTHAQGADAVARALVGGTLRADVFLPITAAPMQAVVESGKATSVQAFARTEMVLLYSATSRFAPQFEAAAKGGTPWWQVLEQPGIRISRSDPAGDPGGRNFVFAMMLAAKKYRQPDLVEKVLGPVLNPQQIAGGNAIERLQRGELDATLSYKTATAFTTVPYLSLPKDVNLSGDRVSARNPDVKLTLNGKTFVPDPLIFFATVLKDAPNPEGAARFLAWLQTSEAQGILRANRFDAVAAGDTPFHKS